MLEKIAQSLRARGFEAETVKSADEACALVMDEAENARSVGWGGSETIKQIGARELLLKSGKEIRDHRTDCDLFLLSANALTVDGRIVNTDGNGNRIAASIHGPGRVVYVIGRNKIVDGGIDAAIARIRNCACPPNARRLGRPTPCALEGRCGDCNLPERMCKVTVIFDRKPTGISAKVILVDENLGY